MNVAERLPTLDRIDTLMRASLHQEQAAFAADDLAKLFYMAEAIKQSGFTKRSCAAMVQAVQDAARRHPSATIPLPKLGA